MLDGDDDDVSWPTAMGRDVAARVFGSSRAISLAADSPKLRVAVFLDADDLAMLAALRDVVANVPEILKSDEEVTLEHHVSLQLLLYDLIRAGMTRPDMLSVADELDQLAKAIRTETLMDSDE